MCKLIKDWWPELLLGGSIAFVGMHFADEMLTNKGWFLVWCFILALYAFFVGCKWVMIVLLHICDEAVEKVQAMNKSVAFKTGYCSALIYVASYLGGVKCNTR